MQTRRLGNSDLEITVVGFGAWAIGGGDWMFGWGPQDDTDSIAAITRAVDLGINWVDTAAAYGLGHSEEMVGRAVNGLPASKRPYVFTKCSLVWNEKRELSHSLRPDSIRREVEGSLTRLGVDVIDLYQIHWPRWGSSPPGYDPGNVADAWQALAELKRDGKVRYIGASNFAVADLEAAERSGLLTGTMTRERVAALPDNDWRRRAKYFQEPYLSQGLTLADKLRSVGAKHGRTAGEAAIAWTLRHAAVTAAIVGARRPDQLDGIVGAADMRLTDADMKQIG